MSSLKLTTKLIDWKSTNPHFSTRYAHDENKNENNINSNEEDSYHMNNIILQDQNGPCFIISLVNLLILRSEILESENRKLLSDASHNVKDTDNDDAGWTTVGAGARRKAYSKAPLSSSTTELDNDQVEELAASTSGIDLSGNVSGNRTKQIRARIESISTLKELVTSKTITYEQLINELIYTVLLFNQDTATPTTKTEENEDVSGILEELHQLETGLNVNVKFNDWEIDDFGKENDKSKTINRLLSLLDVDVVHGFIIPQEQYSDKFDTFDKSQEFLVSVVEKYQASAQIDLDKLSLVELQDLNTTRQDPELDQFIKLSIFLNENKTQLTKTGLELLKTDDEGFPNNTFKLFFRNDHFNTLFKSNGNLYLLINDQGYSKNKDIVWQSLNSINGDQDEYLTGCFDMPSRRILKKRHEVPTSLGDNATATATEMETGTPGPSSSSQSLTDRMLSYDYSYLDEENTDEDPFNEDQSDAMLAKALQSEEDAKLARDLQKTYNTKKPIDKPSKKHKKRTRGKNTSDVLDTGSGEPPKKSAENCIIV